MADDEDEDVAQAPTKEDVDAVVASVEAGLTASGLAVPLAALKAIVALVLRYVTVQGKLEREYAAFAGAGRRLVRASLRALHLDLAEELARVVFVQARGQYEGARGRHSQ